MADEGTHPFGQGEYYFSESQGQAIQIETMAMPYARNVLNKLLREYKDEFSGSPLHDALVKKLVPTRKVLQDVLRGTGQAAIYVGEGGPSVSAARARMVRAGAVETHLNADFLEGVCDPEQFSVKVNKH